MTKNATNMTAIDNTLQLAVIWSLGEWLWLMQHIARKYTRKLL